MKKKTGYKYQIEQELLKQNWEIVEVDTSSAWWDEEHWKVAFKYDSSINFFICFMIDPMTAGGNKENPIVGEIIACQTFPSNWNGSDDDIASIGMTSRKFNIKLGEFMKALEDFKRGRLSK